MNNSKTKMVFTIVLLTLVAFVQVVSAQVEVNSDNGVMTEKNFSLTTA
jgi:regulatory protein YycI of two-component signal transduction system YycFG